MDQYQRFIHQSKYARYIPDLYRRETWEETVTRYISFFQDKHPEVGDEKFEGLSIWSALQNHISDMHDMPSMRAMMTAGPALERDNTAAFNCAYLAVYRQRAFDEVMDILLCGTGAGFSVERNYTTQLPYIAEEMYETETCVVVGDSKIGWATSLREFISLLYAGKVPKWDLSKVRPKGSPLKVFGGRASGPEPLNGLFKFLVNTFNRFKGGQLPTIAVMDVVCKIAEIVVVGGVRRSALIALTDLDDRWASSAKSPQRVMEYTLLGHAELTGKRKYSVIIDDDPYGERSLIIEVDDFESEQLQSKHTIGWWHAHPERALANISAVFTGTPDSKTFLKFWLDLVESGSGERGIFNRSSAIRQVDKCGRRDANHDFGTNPCSEIILQDRQFCNLSEVIVRSGDTFETLARKVRLATILGTLQSTLTDFRYLSRKWKSNTEEERLLGVSLTGIMDHKVLSGAQEAMYLSTTWGGPVQLEDTLEQLKGVAIETNIQYSKKLGIQPATAITCVKPSGTVSQLVDSSSGIHARHGRFYIRTVRSDKKDPLSTYMVEQGFPHEESVTNTNDWVFSFPIKAPEGSVLREDRTAVEQLELWKVYQDHWCEHKPSITVSVRDYEWPEVGAWVYNHFNDISGVSFLPYSEHTYKQAPYQDITEEEYNEWVTKMPVDVDWKFDEEYDSTTSSQEYACVGGACEIT